MPSSTWALAAITLLVGGGAALQGVINAALSRSSGAMGASIVSFTGTFLMGLIVLALGLGGSRGGIVNAAYAPPYLWTGGLFGGAVVLSAVLLIPRVGAATFMVFLVGGLLVGSMLLDHLGVLGLEQHSTTALRVLGGVLVLLGAWLVSSR